MEKNIKRLPTIEEWEWLIYNCKWEWDSNLQGQKVTSDNGNSIFLPAAGYRYDTGFYNVGIDGYYLSSSINMDYPNNVYAALFYSDGVSRNSSNRYSGFSVRLVSDNQQEGFVDMGNGLYWARENYPGLFTYDEAMKLYSKEKQNDAESCTITGWIARNQDGDANFYLTKPHRSKVGPYWRGDDILEILRDEFASLHWEDEPIEVEIKIKRKEESKK